MIPKLGSSLLCVLSKLDSSSLCMEAYTSLQRPFQLVCLVLYIIIALLILGRKERVCRERWREGLRGGLVCVFVCVCVHACVRACVHACVRSGEAMVE